MFILDTKCGRAPNARNHQSSHATDMK